MIRVSVLLVIGLFIISCGNRSSEAVKYYDEGKKLYNEKRFDRASALFTKAYNEDSSLLSALLMQSKIKYYEKNFNASLELQNKILKKNGEHTGALYWKARCIAAGINKNTDEAVKCLIKLLEIDNHHIPARTLLALLYEKNKNFNKAIAEYKKIIMDEEGIINSRINLAMLYKRLGLKDKSLSEINAAENILAAAGLKNPDIALLKMEIEK